MCIAEALEHAGLLPAHHATASQGASSVDAAAASHHVTCVRARAGISFGCAIGSLDDMAAASLQAVKEGGARRISPFFIPKILLNLVGGRAAIRHAMQVFPRFFPVCARVCLQH